MTSSHRLTPLITTAAIVAMVFVALATAVTARAQGDDYFNLSTRAPLRPGVYGRIEVRGTMPPPVIYSHPVLVNQTTVPVTARPVYLYVPPGQVRKWKLACSHWKACNEPVLFVRVDDSPSRWGSWRQWREQMAHIADD